MSGLGSEDAGPAREQLVSDALLPVESTTTAAAAEPPDHPLYESVGDETVMQPEDLEEVRHLRTAAQTAVTATALGSLLNGAAATAEQGTSLRTNGFITSAFDLNPSAFERLARLESTGVSSTKDARPTMPPGSTLRTSPTRIKRPATGRIPSYLTRSKPPQPTAHSQQLQTSTSSSPSEPSPRTNRGPIASAVSTPRRAHHVLKSLQMKSSHPSRNEGSIPHLDPNTVLMASQLYQFVPESANGGTVEKTQSSATAASRLKPLLSPSSQNFARPIVLDQTRRPANQDKDDESTDSIAPLPSSTRFPRLDLKSLTPRSIISRSKKLGFFNWGLLQKPSSQELPPVTPTDPRAETPAQAILEPTPPPDRTRALSSTESGAEPQTHSSSTAPAGPSLSMFNTRKKNLTIQIDADPDEVMSTVSIQVAPEDGTQPARPAEPLHPPEPENVYTLDVQTQAPEKGSDIQLPQPASLLISSPGRSRPKSADLQTQFSLSLGHFIQSPTSKPSGDGASAKLPLPSPFRLDSPGGTASSFPEGTLSAPVTSPRPAATKAPRLQPLSIPESEQTEVKLESASQTPPRSTLTSSTARPQLKEHQHHTFHKQHIRGSPLPPHLRGPPFAPALVPIVPQPLPYLAKCLLKPASRRTPEQLKVILQATAHAPFYTAPSILATQYLGESTFAVDSVMANHQFTSFVRTKLTTTFQNARADTLSLDPNNASNDETGRMLARAFREPHIVARFRIALAAALTLRVASHGALLWSADDAAASAVIVLSGEVAQVHGDANTILQRLRNRDMTRPSNSYRMSLDASRQMENTGGIAELPYEPDTRRTAAWLQEAWLATLAWKPESERGYPRFGKEFRDPFQLHHENMLQKRQSIQTNYKRSEHSSLSLYAVARELFNYHVSLDRMVAASQGRLNKPFEAFSSQGKSLEVFSPLEANADLDSRERSDAALSGVHQDPREAHSGTSHKRMSHATSVEHRHRRHSSRRSLSPELHAPTIHTLRIEVEDLPKVDDMYPDYEPSSPSTASVASTMHGLEPNLRWLRPIGRGAGMARQSGSSQSQETLQRSDEDLQSFSLASPRSRHGSSADFSSDDELNSPTLTAVTRNGTSNRNLSIVSGPMTPRLSTAKKNLHRRNASLSSLSSTTTQPVILESPDRMNDELSPPSRFIQDTRLESRGKKVDVDMDVLPFTDGALPLAKRYPPDTFKVRFPLCPAIEPDASLSKGLSPVDCQVLGGLVKLSGPGEVIDADALHVARTRCLTAVAVCNRYIDVVNSTFPVPLDPSAVRMAFTDPRMQPRRLSREWRPSALSQGSPIVPDTESISESPHSISTVSSDESDLNSEIEIESTYSGMTYEHKAKRGKSSHGKHRPSLRQVGLHTPTFTAATQSSALQRENGRGLQKSFNFHRDTAPLEFEADNEGQANKQSNQPRIAELGIPCDEVTSRTAALILRDAIAVLRPELPAGEVDTDAAQPSSSGPQSGPLGTENLDLDGIELVHSSPMLRILTPKLMRRREQLFTKEFIPRRPSDFPIVLLAVLNRVAFQDAIQSTLLSIPQCVFALRVPRLPLDTKKLCKAGMPVKNSGDIESWSAFVAESARTLVKAIAKEAAPQPDSHDRSEKLWPKQSPRAFSFKLHDLPTVSSRIRNKVRTVLNGDLAQPNSPSQEPMSPRSLSGPDDRDWHVEQFSDPNGVLADTKVIEFDIDEVPAGEMRFSGDEGIIDPDELDVQSASNLSNLPDLGKVLQNVSAKIHLKVPTPALASIASDCFYGITRPMPISAYMPWLLKSPLLRGLPAESLRVLAHYSRAISVPRGTVLYKPKDTDALSVSHPKSSTVSSSDYVYVVISGSVGLFSSDFLDDIPRLEQAGVPNSLALTSQIAFMPYQRDETCPTVDLQNIDYADVVGMRSMGLPPLHSPSHTRTQPQQLPTTAYPSTGSMTLAGTLVPNPYWDASRSTSADNPAVNAARAHLARMLTGSVYQMGPDAPILRESGRFADLYTNWDEESVLQVLRAPSSVKSASTDAHHPQKASSSAMLKAQPTADLTDALSRVPTEQSSAQVHLEPDFICPLPYPSSGNAVAQPAYHNMLRAAGLWSHDLIQSLGAGDIAGLETVYSYPMQCLFEEFGVVAEGKKPSQRRPSQFSQYSKNSEEPTVVALADLERRLTRLQERVIHAQMTKHAPANSQQHIELDTKFLEDDAIPHSDILDVVLMRILQSANPIAGLIPALSGLSGRDLWNALTANPKLPHNETRQLHASEQAAMSNQLSSGFKRAHVSFGPIIPSETKESASDIEYEPSKELERKLPSIVTPIAQSLLSTAKLGKQAVQLLQNAAFAPLQPLLGHVFALFSGFRGAEGTRSAFVTSRHMIDLGENESNSVDCDSGTLSGSLPLTQLFDVLPPAHRRALELFAISTASRDTSAKAELFSLQLLEYSARKVPANVISRLKDSSDHGSLGNLDADTAGSSSLELALVDGEALARVLRIMATLYAGQEIILRRRRLRTRNRIIAREAKRRELYVAGLASGVHPDNLPVPREIAIANVRSAAILTKQVLTTAETNAHAVTMTLGQRHSQRPSETAFVGDGFNSIELDDRHFGRSAIVTDPLPEDDAAKEKVSDAESSSRTTADPLSLLPDKKLVGLSYDRSLSDEMRRRLLAEEQDRQSELRAETRERVREHNLLNRYFSYSTCARLLAPTLALGPRDAVILEAITGVCLDATKQSTEHLESSGQDSENSSAHLFSYLRETRLNWDAYAPLFTASKNDVRDQRNEPGQATTPRGRTGDVDSEDDQEFASARANYPDDEHMLVTEIEKEAQRLCALLDAWIRHPTPTNSVEPQYVLDRLHRNEKGNSVQSENDVVGTLTHSNRTHLALPLALKTVLAPGEALWIRGSSAQRYPAIEGEYQHVAVERDVVALHQLTARQISLQRKARNELRSPTAAIEAAVSIFDGDQPENSVMLEDHTRILGPLVFPSLRLPFTDLLPLFDASTLAPVTYGGPGVSSPGQRSPATSRLTGSTPFSPRRSTALRGITDAPSTVRSSQVGGFNLLTSRSQDSSRISASSQSGQAQLTPALPAYSPFEMSVISRVLSVYHEKHNQFRTSSDFGLEAEVRLASEELYEEALESTSSKTPSHASRSIKAKSRPTSELELDDHELRRLMGMDPNSVHRGASQPSPTSTQASSEKSTRMARNWTPVVEAVYGWHEAVEICSTIQMQRALLGPIQSQTDLARAQQSLELLTELGITSQRPLPVRANPRLEWSSEDIGIGGARDKVYGRLTGVLSASEPSFSTPPTLSHTDELPSVAEAAERFKITCDPCPPNLSLSALRKTQAESARRGKLHPSPGAPQRDVGNPLHPDLEGVIDGRLNPAVEQTLFHRSLPQIPAFVSPPGISDARSLGTSQVVHDGQGGGPNATSKRDPTSQKIGETASAASERPTRPEIRIKVPAPATCIALSDALVLAVPRALLVSLGAGTASTKSSHDGCENAPQSSSDSSGRPEDARSSPWASILEESTRMRALTQTFRTREVVQTLAEFVDASSQADEVTLPHSEGPTELETQERRSENLAGMQRSVTHSLSGPHLNTAPKASQNTHMWNIFHSRVSSIIRMTPSFAPTEHRSFDVLSTVLARFPSWFKELVRPNFARLISPHDEATSAMALWSLSRIRMLLAGDVVSPALQSQEQFSQFEDLRSLIARSTQSLRGSRISRSSVYYPQLSAILDNVTAFPFITPSAPSASPRLIMVLSGCLTSVSHFLVREVLDAPASSNLEGTTAESKVNQQNSSATSMQAQSSALSQSPASNQPKGIPSLYPLHILLPIGTLVIAPMSPFSKYCGAAEHIQRYDAHHHLETPEAQRNDLKRSRTRALRRIFRSQRGSQIHLPFPLMTTLQLLFPDRVSPLIPRPMSSPSWSLAGEVGNAPRLPTEYLQQCVESRLRSILRLESILRFRPTETLAAVVALPELAQRLLGMSEASPTENDHSFTVGPVLSIPAIAELNRRMITGLIPTPRRVANILKLAALTPIKKSRYLESLLSADQPDGLQHRSAFDAFDSLGFDSTWRNVSSQWQHLGWPSEYLFAGEESRTDPWQPNQHSPQQIAESLIRRMEIEGVWSLMGILPFYRPVPNKPESGAWEKLVWDHLGAVKLLKQALGEATSVNQPDRDLIPGTVRVENYFGGALLSQIDVYSGLKKSVRYAIAEELGIVAKSTSLGADVLDRTEHELRLDAERTSGLALAQSGAPNPPIHTSALVKQLSSTGSAALSADSCENVRFTGMQPKEIDYPITALLLSKYSPLLPLPGSLVAGAIPVPSPIIAHLTECMKRTYVRQVDVAQRQSVRDFLTATKFDSTERASISNISLILGQDPHLSMLDLPPQVLQFLVGSYASRRFDVIASHFERYYPPYTMNTSLLADRSQVVKTLRQLPTYIRKWPLPLIQLALTPSIPHSLLYSLFSIMSDLTPAVSVLSYTLPFAAPDQLENVLLGLPPNSEQEQNEDSSKITRREEASNHEEQYDYPLEKSGLYLILEGEVRVVATFASRETDTPHPSRQLLVAKLGPGAAFDRPCTQLGRCLGTNVFLFDRMGADARACRRHRRSSESISESATTDESQLGQSDSEDDVEVKTSLDHPRPPEHRKHLDRHSLYRNPILTRGLANDGVASILLGADSISVPGTRYHARWMLRSNPYALYRRLREYGPPSRLPIPVKLEFIPTTSTTKLLFMPLAHAAAAFPFGLLSTLYCGCRMREARITASLATIITTLATTLAPPLPAFSLPLHMRATAATLSGSVPNVREPEGLYAESRSGSSGLKRTTSPGESDQYGWEWEYVLQLRTVLMPPMQPSPLENVQENLDARASPSGPGSSGKSSTRRPSSRTSDSQSALLTTVTQHARISGSATALRMLLRGAAAEAVIDEFSTWLEYNGSSPSESSRGNSHTSAVIAAPDDVDCPTKLQRTSDEIDATHALRLLENGDPMALAHNWKRFLQHRQYMKPDTPTDLSKDDSAQIRLTSTQRVTALSDVNHLDNSKRVPQPGSNMRLQCALNFAIDEVAKQQLRSSTTSRAIHDALMAQRRVIAPIVASVGSGKLSTVAPGITVTPTVRARREDPHSSRVRPVSASYESMKAATRTSLHLTEPPSGRVHSKDINTHPIVQLVVNAATREQDVKPTLRIVDLLQNRRVQREEAKIRLVGSIFAASAEEQAMLIKQASKQADRPNSALQADAQHHRHGAMMEAVIGSPSSRESPLRARVDPSSEGTDLVEPSLPLDPILRKANQRASPVNDVGSSSNRSITKSLMGTIFSRTGVAANSFVSSATVSRLVGANLPRGLQHHERAHGLVGRGSGSHTEGDLSTVAAAKLMLINVESATALEQDLRLALGSYLATTAALLAQLLFPAKISSSRPEYDESGAGAVHQKNPVVTSLNRNARGENEVFDEKLKISQATTLPRKVASGATPPILHAPILRRHHSKPAYHLVHTFNHLALFGGALGDNKVVPSGTTTQDMVGGQRASHGDAYKQTNLHAGESMTKLYDSQELLPSRRERKLRPRLLAASETTTSAPANLAVIELDASMSSASISFLEGESRHGGEESDNAEGVQQSVSLYLPSHLTLNTSATDETPDKDLVHTKPLPPGYIDSPGGTGSEWTSEQDTPRERKFLSPRARNNVLRPRGETPRFAVPPRPSSQLSTTSSSSSHQITVTLFGHEQPDPSLGTTMQPMEPVPPHHPSSPTTTDSVSSMRTDHASRARGTPRAAPGPTRAAFTGQPASSNRAERASQSEPSSNLQPKPHLGTKRPSVKRQDAVGGDVAVLREIKRHVLMPMNRGQALAKAREAYLRLRVAKREKVLKEAMRSSANGREDINPKRASDIPTHSDATQASDPPTAEVAAQQAHVDSKRPDSHDESDRRLSIQITPAQESEPEEPDENRAEPEDAYEEEAEDRLVSEALEEFFFDYGTGNRRASISRSNESSSTTSSSDNASSEDEEDEFGLSRAMRRSSISSSNATSSRRSSLASSRRSSLASLRRASLGLSTDLLLRPALSSAHPVSGSLEERRASVGHILTQPQPYSPKASNVGTHQTPGVQRFSYRPDKQASSTSGASVGMDIVIFSPQMQASTSDSSSSPPRPLSALDTGTQASLRRPSLITEASSVSSPGSTKTTPWTRDTQQRRRSYHTPATVEKRPPPITRLLSTPSKLDIYSEKNGQSTPRGNASSSHDRTTSQPMPEPPKSATTFDLSLDQPATHPQRDLSNPNELSESHSLLSAHSNTSVGGLEEHGLMVHDETNHDASALETVQHPVSNESTETSVDNSPDAELGHETSRRHCNRLEKLRRQVQTRLLQATNQSSTLEMSDAVAHGSAEGSVHNEKERLQEEREGFLTLLGEQLVTQFGYEPSEIVTEGDALAETLAFLAREHYNLLSDAVEVERQFDEQLADEMTAESIGSSQAVKTKEKAEAYLERVASAGARRPVPHATTPDDMTAAPRPLVGTAAQPVVDLGDAASALRSHLKPANPVQEYYLKHYGTFAAPLHVTRTGQTERGQCSEVVEVRTLPDLMRLVRSPSPPSQQTRGGDKHGKSYEAKAHQVIIDTPEQNASANNAPEQSPEALSDLDIESIRAARIYRRLLRLLPTLSGLLRKYQEAFSHVKEMHELAKVSPSSVKQKPVDAVIARSLSERRETSGLFSPELLVLMQLREKRAKSVFSTLSREEQRIAMTTLIELLLTPLPLPLYSTLTRPLPSSVASTSTLVATPASFQMQRDSESGADHGAVPNSADERMQSRSRVSTKILAIRAWHDRLHFMTQFMALNPLADEADIMNSFKPGSGMQ